MDNATLLPLRGISLDGETQPRASIDMVVVAEYAAAIESGSEFPPVTVFHDGKHYWLADGFHRWHAHEQVGAEQIAAIINKGSVEAARWFSYSANAAHGLRRSNEDKRASVVGALSHPKGAKMSDRKIAEHCGVSQPFVGKVRAELTDNGYQSTSLGPTLCLAGILGLFVSAVLPLFLWDLTRLHDLMGMAGLVGFCFGVVAAGWVVVFAEPRGGRHRRGMEA